MIKFFQISIIIVFSLNLLPAKTIGIFSGYNNHSILTKKNQHESLLSNLIELSYFNLQYFFNEKNSLGVELNINGDRKNNLSIQHRYGLMKNQNFFVGHSISLDENDNSNYNILLGLNRNIRNALILGVITSVPTKNFKSIGVNIYAGAKL